jgi:hypothetical protein
MRATRIAAGLVVMVLVGAFPLMAAESAAPATPEVSQSSPAPALPGGTAGLFTPEPSYRYGVMGGPCTVSITCLDHTVLRCSGQTVCYWRGDATPSRGFVECDGRRSTCGLIE